MALGALSTVSFAKDKYKKWLEEEVVWIISKAEREEFESLTTNEGREAFIDRFWKRRDPTPSTERNEYKEEHYRRILYAREKFREGIPGWKTDRGRVYILHGPPDNEYFFNSRQVYSLGRDVPSTAHNPNTVIWTYHQNPDATYYRGEITLVFQPSMGASRQTFVMSESKTAQERADQLSRRFQVANPTWLESDVRYQLVMAGPPTLINSKGADLPSAGLSELTRYLDDLLRSPGELVEQREKEIQRREEAKKTLRTSAKTDISFGTVPFDLSVESFARPAGDWLLPVKVAIHLDEDLTDEKLDVYAALLDSDGEIFDEFIDSVSLEALPTAMKLVDYFNSFSVPSGDYTLRVAVRGVESRRTGFDERKLRLSDTRTGKTRLGAVMLTNRVEWLPDSSEQEGDIEEKPEVVAGDASLVYNRARLLPNPSSSFHQEDYLFAFMQVWPSQPGARVALSGKFIRENQVVGRLDSRTLDLGKSNFTEYGTAVPLAGFDPGEYTLQLQAIDLGTRSFDIVRVPFTLLGTTAAPDQAASGRR